VSEKSNVAGARPDLVRELAALALALDAEIERGARPRGSSAATLFDPARPGS